MPVGAPVWAKVRIFPSAVACASPAASSAAFSAPPVMSTHALPLQRLIFPFAVSYQMSAAAGDAGAPLW